MITPPTWLTSRFPVVDGVMQIAGRPVTDWVKEFGSPIYLYDGSVLQWRHDALRKALPRELAITYAIKANPNPAIVERLGKLYDGVDLASRGEMEVALAAGIPASKMSFAGPGKSRDEIRFAVEQGIGTLSIESERELEHIREFAKASNTKARILIRINPPFELVRAGLKMGGGPKQFGIDSERVPALIASLANMPEIEYCGFHIFSGTQNLNADSILEAMGKILHYGAELIRETKVAPRIVNLGGGFGIPYFNGDSELDLGPLGEGIGTLLRQYRSEFPETQFKIELGRYIVGECGFYLTSVRYRKISRGQVFLVLDGGMHHHLPASGNISQSPLRRQMLLAAANRMNSSPEKVFVVGPLCTPLDTFGQGVELPALEEGDILAIPNSGAYGYSISPLGFLSHPFPREILV